MKPTGRRGHTRELRRGKSNDGTDGVAERGGRRGSRRAIRDQQIASRHRGPGTAFTSSVAQAPVASSAWSSSFSSVASLVSSSNTRNLDALERSHFLEETAGADVLLERSRITWRLERPSTFQSKSTLVRGQSVRHLPHVASMNRSPPHDICPTARGLAGRCSRDTPVHRQAHEGSKSPHGPLASATAPQAPLRRSVR